MPRPPLGAVQFRCKHKGHLLLSVHPLTAGRRTPGFALWIRAGRFYPLGNDHEAWQRVGSGEAPAYTTLPESLFILGMDDIRGPFHPLRQMACRCGVRMLDYDVLKQALAEWDEADRPTRPILRHVA